ncbi:class I SAM-dependent methyltransferase [Rhizobium ruizarguesonis]|uniref:class I SAM-dependent methyltransferase n=1 Tax=Rhizobium ruizarguesonis TaxID=2081791 RepID=UPI0013B8B3EC|nr:class I SAM-dependent methyltransferase [Rhizobium ruizarguesonis]NEI07822.1 methyltransferase domain-containing protein [Rhizobium ruizarguesonis]
MPIELQTLATRETFNEVAYLAANQDVAAAVKAGMIESGKVHFEAFGRNEKRYLRGSPGSIEPLREIKLQRIADFLRSDLPTTTTSGKPDFLSPELREISGITSTEAVSSNSYDGQGIDLINKHRDGLVLDCGAGRRDVYYENVINFEIVDYDTTDVLGVGEELPFKDGTFDAVISIAVLEHVKDPFRCAREIIRVLKPGGDLYCAVPFLQPLHGYPHHYYNMSHQGLRSLFDHSMTITEQDVPKAGWPIWTLTWFLQRWHAQLPEKVRASFRHKTIGDLLQPADRYLNEEWVKALPKAAQFELASITTILATKPDPVR